MSIKNLLIDNDYNLYCNRLSVKDLVDIVGDLIVNDLSVNNDASVVNDLSVGNDASVTHDLTVGDGIYIGTQTAPNYLAAYDYVKYQCLAATGINGGAAGGFPYLSYCRIGNHVTVTFQAGVAGQSGVTASGGVLITTAQLGTIGASLASDYLKLPKASQCSFVCRVEYGAASDLGYCIFESGGLSFKNAASGDLVAGDVIFNFSFSYNVDY